MPRAVLVRFREAVAQHLRDNVSAADMSIRTGTMPRTQVGDKIAAGEVAGKTVVWVLLRSFTSEPETRSTNARELAVDVAVYSPVAGKTEADRDAEGDAHQGKFEQVLALLERDGFKLPADAGEVDLFTRCESLELQRLLDGPSLDQRNMLCSVMTLTHSTSVQVT